MTKKSTKLRAMTALLLAGWCLLFFRCETTEKSMVRAVYLAQTENGVTAALWVQAPQAAADASEASAVLKMTRAEDETLEKALYSAQKLLPETADYRLCDFLLFPENTPDELLSEYETLVLERGCGRTAARLVCMELNEAAFERLESDDAGFSDKLLGKLKEQSARFPRLYRHREAALYSTLAADGNAVELDEDGFFRTPETRVELDANKTELCLLLQQTPGARTFWLEGERVAVRRCSVSVTLRGDRALLRLDCQLPAGEPIPSDAQKKQLEALACDMTETLWKQGIDLLSLQQRRALAEGADTTKNACPELRADIRFLKF